MVNVTGITVYVCPRVPDGRTERTLPPPIPRESYEVYTIVVIRFSFSYPYLILDRRFCKRWLRSTNTPGTTNKIGSLIEFMTTVKNNGITTVVKWGIPMRIPRQGNNSELDPGKEFPPFLFIKPF